MTVLTPTAMLELPRPAPGILSPSGLHYAQSSSEYSFNTRQTTRTVVLGSVPDHKSSAAPHAGAPSAFISNASSGDILWADDDTLLFTRPSSNSNSTGDSKHGGSAQDASANGLEIWAKEIKGSEREYRVGVLPVDDAGDFKIHHVSPSEAVLAFSARVYGPDRSVYNATKRAKEIQEAKDGSEGMVYDKLFVRHWDTFLDSSIKQIHVVRLVKKEPPATSDAASLHSLPSDEANEQDHDHDQEEEGWHFEGPITSPMADTLLECPVGPFGDSSDYDLTADQLLLTAKDPKLPPAWHTRQHVYLIQLNPKSADHAKPACLTGLVGATSSPRFSPDAKTVAWLEMRKDGYEADRNRVMLHDLKKGNTRGVTENWDRSPGSITWSEDGRQLYLTAEEHGRGKLWMLDMASEGPPKALTNEGTVTSVQVIPTPTHQAKHKDSPVVRLLISATSHVSPTFVSVLDTMADGSTRQHTVSALADPKLKSLQPSLKPATDFWFDGAQTKVHGWKMLPPTYDEHAESKSKWPLAFLIHGGPQGSWTDSWSTRWNLAVFASQGYITVAIDPTGSTGYGQKFTDDIQLQWGGLPYEDLVRGYKHVLETCPMIDRERTAALGASYGGYMVNWIQGHNPGFNALVCHDGVFDTEATWFETEEIYFPEHENGGNTPWENPRAYDKWNPKNHIPSFATPQLVIHGGKDYRLPETQGMAMFTSLQRRGIPSRFLYFANENHWVLNPRNSRQWHQEIFKWLKEWI